MKRRTFWPALVKTFWWVLVFGLGWLGGYAQRSLKQVRPSPATGEPVAEAADKVVDYSALAFESQEGRLATMLLADENAELKQKLETLGQQLDETMLAAASDKMKADLLRIDWEKNRTTDRPALRDEGVQGLPWLALVDTDEDLGMVALAGGTRQGLKVGMRFHVLRDDRVLGRIRVVEVRETVAGAVVERPWKAFPALGDRVIPASAAQH